VAIADPHPQHTEAPTQETSTLPRVPESERPALRVPSPAPGCYLAVEKGEDVELLPLDGTLVRIGRNPAADIVLDDASVSRRHALVTRRGERTVILDDRSRNGVYVNGARVSEADLSDGDTIALGRVLLRFVERA
jgi:hypothetical protein